MAEEKKKRTEAAAGQPPAEDEVIQGEIVEEGPESEDNSEERNGMMAKEYQELTNELEQAQGKAKEFFEGWQRERADFANYKRRVERDQQALAQNIKGEIIKRYLPVLDDLERAMKGRPTEGPAANWADGIELVMRKLQSILESEGVRRIPAETEEFNPNRHEAITYEESPDHESGQVIDVVQQGYMLGDRVLRPALVRVAR